MLPRGQSSKGKQLAVKQVAALVRKRRRAQGDVFYYWSPKCERDVCIRGQLAFYFALLAEVDPEVAFFEVLAETDAPCTLRVHKRSSPTGALVETWRFRYLRDANQDLEEVSADGARVDYDVRLVGREHRLANSLRLCACIARARRFDQAREIGLIQTMFARQKRMLLGDLLAIDGGDRALLLAVVAKLILAGTVRADLDAEPLNDSTEVSVAGISWDGGGH